jgi:hypothetical protein
MVRTRRYVNPAAQDATLGETIAGMLLGGALTLEEVQERLPAVHRANVSRALAEMVGNGVLFVADEEDELAARYPMDVVAVVFQGDDAP